MNRRILLCLLLWVPLFSMAHEARPLYIQVEAVTPTDAGSSAVFDVGMHIPDTLPLAQAPVLTLEPVCRATTWRSAAMQGGVLRKARFTCKQAPSRLDLDFPRGNPSLTTLVRFVRPGAGPVTEALPPGTRQWEIPLEATWINTLGQYAWLGVVHIFLGIDHLLFLACLVFIARHLRRIVWAVTGFTLAHSLTLAASTLGVVTLPIAAVEACIALSVAFLAHEIALGERPSLAWQRPGLVSMAFGLLHGFGFAAVLQDIGLPAEDRLLALFAFNLGVEAGQLAFILAVVGVAVVAQRIFASAQSLLAHRHVAQVASYFIGTTACFWMLQRLQ